mgnify:FL=1
MFGVNLDGVGAIFQRMDQQSVVSPLPGLLMVRISAVKAFDGVIVGDILSVDALFSGGVACFFSVFVIVSVISVDIFGCLFLLDYIFLDGLFGEPLPTALTLRQIASQAYDSSDKNSGSQGNTDVSFVI